jgi:hypothetical protein
LNPAPGQIEEAISAYEQALAAKMRHRHLLNLAGCLVEWQNAVKNPNRRPAIRSWPRRAARVEPGVCRPQESRGGFHLIQTLRLVESGWR